MVQLKFPVETGKLGETFATPSQAIRESPQLSDGFEYERRMFARLRARHSSRTILWPWIVELTRCFTGFAKTYYSAPNIESNRYRIEHVDRENGLFFLGKQNSLDFYEEKKLFREIMYKNMTSMMWKERIKKNKRKKSYRK